jgi:hypothetical protein
MEFILNFNITTEDRNTIAQIGDRFDAIATRLGRNVDRLGIELDVIFCHLNDVKLDLDRLLSADDSNFVHDVAGINRHIDRKTGKLQDCFYPRFAVRQ